MMNQFPLALYRIGVTGGIATGKTTVTDYLAGVYGFPVLDADHYAREAVQRGSVILAAIARRYGQDILNPDGTLNRAVLGQIIFNDPQERKWVEGQIHPFVRDRISAQLQHLNQQKHIHTAILAIPLLIEANMTDLVDQIWVISCSREQQIQRLMVRNNLTVKEAEARINSQFPLSEKEKWADVVIYNNGTKEELYQKIEQEISNSVIKIKNITMG